MRFLQILFGWLTQSRKVPAGRKAGDCVTWGGE
jgi:hypothetical protein